MAAVWLQNSTVITIDRTLPVSIFFYGFNFIFTCISTFSMPAELSTEVKDSISLVLAMGSIPLLMISCMQSQVLSRSKGWVMNRKKTGTNRSLAMRPMSIHDTYAPTTFKHVQTNAGFEVS